MGRRSAGGRTARWLIFALGSRAAVSWGQEPPAEPEAPPAETPPADPPPEEAPPEEAPPEEVPPNEETPSDDPPAETPPSESPPAEEAPALPALPVLLEAPPAPYPEEALARRLEASVLLELALTAEGSVVSASVVEPAGMGFDEAALEAARNFRFRPALDETGAPVPATIQYRYRFTLAAVPTVSVAGVVRAAGTRQPVAGARVVILDSQGTRRVAMSGEDGTFRFADLPDGQYTLAVRASGMGEEAIPVEVVSGRVTEASLYLVPSREWEMQVADDEMIVTGERLAPEVTERALSEDEIRMMPGTGGDIVRAVQSLPGVARTPFNVGYLLIRGTSPEDSGFFLGGVTLPQVFHFGGLSTVINADSLEEVAYLPGSYSVRYGRYLGGVVDLRTDTIVAERTNGNVAIDVFQSTLFLEHRTSDNFTLSLSARRSYIDAILSPIVNQNPGYTVRLPRYWDLQTRLLHRADGGTTTEVMILASDDRFTYSELSIEGENTQSELVNNFQKLWLRQRAVLGGGWMWENVFIAGPGEIRANYQDAHSAFHETDQAAFRSELYRGVPEGGWAGWRLGVDLIGAHEDFRYDVSDVIGYYATAELETGEARALYPAVYLEQTQREGPIEGVLGVRADWMLLESGLYAASSTDPRLSIRYTPRDETQLSSSVGLYSQFPQIREVLRAAGGNPNLTAENAVQASAGVKQEITPLITGEVTVYGALLSDLVVGHEDRFTFILGPPPTAPLDTGDYANDGTGRNLGVEWLFRYEDPRLVVWLGGAASRATRVKRPSQGRSLFEYDQPLLLTSVATYQLPKRWQVGARLRLGSGNPYTPVANRIFLLDDHTFQPLYDLDNSERMPAYFTLDLRVDKAWTFDRWVLRAYLDLMNATNRKNVELITWSFDWSEELPVYGLPILPIFGVKGEW